MLKRWQSRAHVPALDRRRHARSRAAAREDHSGYRDLAKLALAVERELHRHPTQESRFPVRIHHRTAAEIPRRPGHPPRADSKGVTIQVYRPRGRPQYATLQKLGTRAVVAEALVAEAANVESAVRLLCRSAGGGDLAAAKAAKASTAASSQAESSISRAHRGAATPQPDVPDPVCSCGSGP
jgi:hypothetical protein